MKSQYDKSLAQQKAAAVLVAIGFLLFFLRNNMDIFDAIVLFVFGAK